MKFLQDKELFDPIEAPDYQRWLHKALNKGRGGYMAQVKVFSTPTCPYCLKAKDYLKEKGVAFEAVDVSSDHAGLEEMIRASGQMGVPVIVVDNDVIVGFDKERLNAKLGL